MVNFTIAKLKKLNSLPSLSLSLSPSLPPQSEQCMHLTNYAINKHSSEFVRDDDSGSKRRITTVNQWFRDNGYDVDKIWHDIEVKFGAIII